MHQGRYAIWLREMRRRLAFMPRRLTLLSLAVMAGIMLAAAGLIAQSWLQVKRTEEQAAWNLALAVSNDFNRSMGNENHGLDGILSAIPLDSAGPRREAMLREDVRAARDQFGALLMIDDQAQVRASTSDQFKTGSIAKQFKAAIDEQNLALGKPVATAGERWLPLLRPIGQVGGRDLTIVALLGLSYFEKPLRALPRDPQTAFAVFEPDGARLLRVPEMSPSAPTDMPDSVTRALAKGEVSSFTGPSPLDHHDHMVLVMRDGAFPVGIVVSVPLSEFVLIWLPQAAVVVVLAALLLLLMVILHLALATELHRRHQAEARVAAAVEEANRVGAQYRLLADFSSDVIIEIGFDGICRYVSPAMESMLGWTNADLVGHDSAFWLHPDDAALLHEEVQFLTKGCGPIMSRARHLHRDGRYRWIEASMQVADVDGRADSFIANFRDITDRIETERKLAEAAAAMARLAATDQLTGVANRRRFNEELEREWRRTAREELPLSLLLLDVDFFKTYNDSYGHQGGDDVLKLVASTIENALRRPADLVARWGGEEFVVLLPVTDVAGAVEVAEIVRAAIETLHIPHRGSACGYLTVSVGVATGYPSRNHAPGPLLAEADANLYEAKRQGRNRVGAPPIDPVMWAGM